MSWGRKGAGQGRRTIRGVQVHTGGMPHCDSALLGGGGEQRNFLTVSQTPGRTMATEW